MATPFLLRTQSKPTKLASALSDSNSDTDSEFGIESDSNDSDCTFDQADSSEPQGTAEQVPGLYTTCHDFKRLLSHFHQNQFTRFTQFSRLLDAHFGIREAPMTASAGKLGGGGARRKPLRKS